jgi:hypothetical protein
MGRPHRRSVVTLLVALLVGLSATAVPSPVAAAPVVPYEGPSWMARLAMVGDSLTWTSVDTFRPAFQAEWWRPAIFSYPGVRTETMRGQVRAMAADRPDAFVVELGGMDTIDIISGARPWSFEQAQISGTIVDIQAAGVPCVVWVGPNENVANASISAWSEAINDEIQYQLALRGAGPFADWTAVADGHPEYFVEDGSHLTALGKQVYASMINRELRDCSRNPRGSLDAVSGAIGVQAQGWTYDPDTPSGANDVHVYVDGAFKATMIANGSRPDVAAAFPGVSANHGFAGAFAVGGGTHQVCAFAINNGPYGFKNSVLGCRSVTVDGSPQGFVDSVVGGTSSVRARGWVIDADVTSEVGVHVYVDGVFKGAAAANGSRSDLAAVFPAYGGNHGFDVTVGGLATGTHEVCVYGINAASTSGQNRLLACRSAVS